MHDLSHTGCRIEFREATIELGGTALVDLPGGLPQVAGSIVWVRGTVAGIRFHRRLGKAASIALGLDEPEPEPEETDYSPARDPDGGGLLRHWIRRLTGVFS